MSEFAPLFDAVVYGDSVAASDETTKALSQGVLPETLLEQAAIPAMDEVGRKFDCNDFFVPELLLASRAMQACMKILNPVLEQRGVTKAGRIVIGTVQGDLHDIGKNLVGAMLTGGGFDVVDLGVDVSPEKFIEKAKEKEDTIIALSALLTTTMPEMKRVVELLVARGIRDRYKVMIGGAPVTQTFADEIGADGYSENASGAVALARKLIAV